MTAFIMKSPSAYLDALTKEFAKLPGVGPKSALRLAYYVLSMTIDDVNSLTGALIDVKKHIVTCSICGGIADHEVCPICADETRKNGSLCIVKDAKDVITIESTGEFRGRYHVLHGLISPLDGIGPADLNMPGLINRCEDEDVKEVIIALNPTVEGDATALYLARLLEPLDVIVTRIAHGLPVGADLEFADRATIARSLEYRIKL